MKRNNVKDYFPKNYQESRAEFNSMTKQIQAPCETGNWKIASKTSDDLSVDYAWLPPLKTPEKLLVLITGIHGSETYTGAAVLKLFIEEILPQTNRDDLGIFIVHAMNPFGFKNHRRCTENNVNLNRNFSVSGNMFNLKNSESIRLNELFLSREPVSTEKSKLAQSFHMKDQKAFFGDVSLDHLTKAVSAGQFEKEKDLEYGGQKLEPQTKALIDKMNELMPQFQDVVALDIHTGLGDRGRLHLLTDSDKRSLNPDLFSTIFKPAEDNEFYVFTSADTEGFYEVHGSTNSMYSELVKGSQRVCAVTLEFGTLGHSFEQQMEDMNVSTLDHQGHLYGYADEKLKQKILAANFQRSYPDDDKWRTQVLTAAEGFLTRVLSRFLNV